MLKRRSFIKSGLTLAASSPLWLHAEDKKARNIKKALKYGMIKDGAAPEDKFRIAKEAGFDGVEPDSPFTTDQLKSFQTAVHNTGTLIPGTVFGGGHGSKLVDPDVSVRKTAVENFKLALAQTRDLGGTTVLMYPGIVNEQISYNSAYNRLIECNEQLLETAQTTGVKIALENVWNNLFTSPRDAASFVQHFNHDYLGWYLDIGNLVRYGWPEHWIEALGPKIFKLDIKEYSRKKQSEEGIWKGFNVELMEGDINWPSVMKALDEVPYRGGWMSAEVGGGNLERLTFISEKLNQIRKA